MNVLALNKRAIEGYLKQYSKIKEDVRQMEEEIAESTMTASMELKNPYAVGDPTAKKAVLFTSLGELNYMRRIVSAIEAARPRMKQRQRLVYEEYFLKGTYYLNVCEKACIEKSTFYNCVREIVAMVAEELGMPV